MFDCLNHVLYIYDITSVVGMVESGRFLGGAVRAQTYVAERAPEGGAREAAGLLRPACAHIAFELRPRLGHRPPCQLSPALSGTHIYDVHIFVISKESLSVV